MKESTSHIIWFDQISRGDVSRVGGKNASLGEMIVALKKERIQVPEGFATTADAYWIFVSANKLEVVIKENLSKLHSNQIELSHAGLSIRNAFYRSKWPDQTISEIQAAYELLSDKTGKANVDVAVRSSATAEDLPEASFAGQQESFLNIRGEDALLDACRKCYASLFTDRAISYREAKGFDHLKVALSIGIQKMVRSDLGSAGVMFSIDTETGFNKVVVINAAWGLGENIVQGTVDPDEYLVFKSLLGNDNFYPIIERKLGSKKQKMIYTSKGDIPTQNISTSSSERDAFVLDDPLILQLAKWACIIEKHYGIPMDIEWARDGETGELFIVQARPETVQSQKAVSSFRSWQIESGGKKLGKGLAIGQGVVSAPVCIINNSQDIEHYVDGTILVTETTDPDWVPVMKNAAAIITDYGGRTSHAAIVSRELGLPAIVSAGNMTSILKNNQIITVSCAEGDEGYIYDGKVQFSVEEIEIGSIPSTRTKIMLNLANPAAAFKWWRIPADGIGLARMEFVINNYVKVHPMALVHFSDQRNELVKRDIEKLTYGYKVKTDYFVDRLSLGLSRIAAVYYPNPVIIRMSDFKTNEYANLIGGSDFEPHEENPMLGFRGASRYYSPLYKAGFALECKAIRRLRDEMGFKNVIVMIPFCRTVEEADLVLKAMSENGLTRGEDGMEVYVMCEIPSNVILAREFAKRFDGFSIGSNDLTQLTLGIDRDSSELSGIFDDQNEAVRWMIERAIKEAHAGGAKIGLCGQAPSDHPEFAAFLVNCGIDSISVTPDSFLEVKRHVATAEKASAD
ncbi:MAG: phosphoenolpyruvate synthase [Gammaproteobacteria bacterium]|nr:phosphoenolpyruvate synthase [Gammaproteobacteria bacterium]NIN62038.1 phosphoenolpyruvate synthase [Gammaproteobacteria bacterium]NIO62117.1 phosphoenolpyruvate synthase [Gammaproteobacteria bacterium]NIQ08273.1 phosphoenolpyruvate synthase [Gammaproteobacteria bacterium]NIQ19829.1 phosphoenolpyruvate synthase [Gammaproteobacteria bacterium]